MAAPIPLRVDYDVKALRRLAKRSDDADQTRRLLALAAVYDGGSRSAAAGIGGVGLQTVRDWVLRKPLLAVRRVCSLALAEERIDASGESFHAPRARDFAIGFCRDFQARDRPTDGTGAVEIGGSSLNKTRSHG